MAGGPDADRCPACGSELFGWLQVRANADDRQILLQRCETCGLGIAAHLARERAPAGLLGPARELPDGRLAVRLANRDSVQARLGGRHWAALEAERRLYATPESLRRLAAAAGLRVVEIRAPSTARSQAWMWQTIVNAFTFEENFVRNVRAGTLRPGDRPLRFAIDAIVSAVAAIPAVLVSAPLELVAAVAGRGGELVAFVSRAETNGSGALS